MNDLKKFVSVALNNAVTGEDTLTNAKLSSLRTVGSGFGCLIYDLPKEAGFEVLKQQCMLLWKNMITTPDLPQYLVSIRVLIQYPLHEGIWLLYSDLFILMSAYVL